MSKVNYQKSTISFGFTLIELLIVIAIIAILASVVFVALDPLTRFRDSRDATRMRDAISILDAIKIDQVDNGGTYITSVNNMVADLVYMINDGNIASNCDDYNSYCDVNVDNDGYCVDLSGLVTEGYLGDVPVSPNGEGSWNENYTGYTLEKSSAGIIYVRACESENSPNIETAR